MQESFYLSFKTLPGEPYIPMDQTFSLGSEVGDYLIHSTDIASRHCIFETKQNIVTITDLGSVQGTWVEGIQLEAGKTTILIPGDQIRLGESVIVDFIAAKEVNPAFHLHHWDEVEKRREKKDIVPRVNIKVEPAELEKVEEKLDKEYNKNRELEFDIDETTIKVNSAQITLRKMAGPIRRFMALILDIIICMIVMIVLETSQAQDYLLAVLKEFVGDGITVKFLEFFIVYMSCFILGTVFLKVSLGQKLMGIYSNSRSRSIIRSLINVVTAPFLIFDLALLADRQSFKELVTRELLLFNSSYGWLKSLLGFIGVILILLVSPLFKGGKFYRSHSILINVQNQNQNQKQNNLKSESALSRQNLFSLSLSEGEEVAIRLPYTMGQLKGLQIFDRNHPRSAIIIRDKQLKFFSLLKKAFSKDPLLSRFYPFLSKRLNGRIFSRNWEHSEKIKYQSEVFDLIKTSFNLSLSTYLQHLTQRGPFISSYAYFKNSLIKEIGDFNSIEALQMPSATLYFFSKDGVSEKQVLLPIAFQNTVQSLLLKPGQASNLDMLKSLTRDHYFSFANWDSNFRDLDFPYSAEGLVEILLLLEKKQIKLTSNISRHIYQAYFSKAKELLKSSLSLRNDIHNGYEQSLKDFIKTLSLLSSKQPELIERLTELLQKWKAGEKSFWGINS